MYRSDHVAIAKAIRDGSAKAGLNTDDIEILTDSLAAVCEARTPAAAKFDPELFRAYALSPVLSD
jgi:hypothetical protein